MATLDSARVLVDTSVWIEYFRGKEPSREAVDRPLEEGRVLCAGIVLAELIQGAKTEKEVTLLLDFLQVFDFLHETPGLWARAGRLSFDLRRKGATLGLADCVLAILAADAEAEVFSYDVHFGILERENCVKLLPME